MREPVVVLVGAGLSTASGIPDYRSSGGMWEMFDPNEFHIDRFLADPDRFWRRRVHLMHTMRILDARPNEGHRILADAVRSGQVAHIITQNVDGLHHKAGTPEDRVIEVHGNSAMCRCIDCGQTRSSRDVVDGFDGVAPRCACGGLLKPDVVLFGEPVPKMDRAIQVVQDARTFVVVGTSLQVWPVAGLVQDALHGGTDLVIVNGTATPFDQQAAAVHRGDAVDGLRAVFQSVP